MKTRILHVVPDLVPYGLERVVASLITHRDRFRYEVSVVSLYGELEGSIARDLTAEGAKVYHLDKRRGFDARMFNRLAGVLVDAEPHILHTHNYVLRYALPASLFRRIPVVVHTLHNIATQEVDRLGRWLQWWAFRHRVHPVAIAGEVASTFRQVYGLPQPTLIPNGIAVDAFQSNAAERAAWRAQEGFSPEDILYICVARFSEQKNHPALLEAFAAGPGKNPHARLLLAGDGALRQKTEAIAAQLGITSRMRFLGRREDVPQLLAASDVFVLASLWEGNPLSVMEAMAAGLPCVVTSVGGVPELVESGKHGFVVPPADPASLAGAMMKLASDPVARRRMGAAAAACAAERFDHRHMVAAYEKLYQRLLPAEARASLGDLAASRN